MARTLGELDQAFDEHVKDSQTRMDTVANELKGLRADIKPAVDLMTSGKVIDKVARYCLGSFVALVSLLVALKELDTWGFIRSIFK